MLRWSSIVALWVSQWVFILLVVTPAHALSENVSITGPNRTALIEGRKYVITWKESGLTSVSVIAFGTRTPLGEESRGDFTIEIAENAPASWEEVEWTVPWIDSVRLTLKIKGYNSKGELVTSDQREYGFRPAVMAKRLANGIYLDLRKESNQRLYVQKNYKIIHAYLSSSSRDYKWLPRNRHIPQPHDHAGVFKVIGKEKMHWSRLFNVEMPYAMRYFGGHYIHATSSNLYEYLGEPASSGCNRLTLHDAMELYNSTPIGTRVEVIGPNG